jgi:hypothetical protein
MKKLGIVICIPQPTLRPAIHNVVPPNQQQLTPPPTKYPSLIMYYHSTVITGKPLIAKREYTIQNW